MNVTRDSKDTVRLPVLISLILGACIGSGIFALPQNVANVASPGAAIIGWTITGVGMLCIAFVFQSLAQRKPHLDSGVYSYVRAGLGDFVGFASGRSVTPRCSSAPWPTSSPSSTDATCCSTPSASPC